jgi:hypothetical protein
MEGKKPVTYDRIPVYCQSCFTIAFVNRLKDISTLPKFCSVCHRMPAYKEMDRRKQRVNPGGFVE